MLPCRILCYYKSLMPSKSITKKSNHDLKGKYPYVPMGTLKTYGPKAAVFAI